MIAADRGPVVDFATVAIKAKYNGKWLGATEASAVRANFDVPELTHGYTTFSIFKVSHSLHEAAVFAFRLYTHDGKQCGR